MKDPADSLLPLEELVMIDRPNKHKGGHGKKQAPVPNPGDFPAKDVVAGYRAPPFVFRKLNKRFNAIMLRKMELYRMDAIDALRDLAMMPISENALLNQVKYMAACRLAGPQQETPLAPSEIDTTLRELNNAYHSAAPRIKSVRERVITFEQEPALIEGG